MDYPTLRFTHVSCVIISYALFVVRGIWMMRSSTLLQSRWVRVMPHVVDTVLLASAVALAFVAHQYPIANDWLTAKVIGLLLYIALGTIALRRGKTRRARIGAWVGAQAVYLYIVAVAITRNPLPLYR